jgi:hypothetical protein
MTTDLCGVIHSHQSNQVMKKNMGSADRIFRILVAIVIAALFFANVISGSAAIILMILAVVFLLTGFIGLCPLYMLFGISTCKSDVKTT